MDLMAKVRAKQPAIIMNNRLFRSAEAGWKSMGTDGFANSLDTKYGDFITPEQHIPATGMPGVDWETCMTLNTTWGFSEHDHAWKSDETLIRNLVDIASKGGNYLLNIGPKGDGSVPPESVKSMKAIGAWMKVNGESIHATSASPFPSLPWGRATQKGAALYLHVFDWPADGVLDVPMKADVAKAVLLAASGTALAVTADGAHLKIRLPASAPDPIATVIRLDLRGAPRIDPTLKPPAPGPGAKH
jgi:alpha-L-fucosidase